jgi:hypothetical protein
MPWLLERRLVEQLAAAEKSRNTMISLTQVCTLSANPAKPVREEA